MSYHRPCDWCGQYIRGNPFTRSWLDEVRLYCSEKCMDDHRADEKRLNEVQPRFNFDVVAG